MRKAIYYITSRLVVLLVLFFVCSITVAAQVTSLPPKQEATPALPRATTPDTPSQEQNPSAPWGDYRSFYGPGSIPVERGVRVSVGNRTTGRITIVGWDRDVIEVVARSERGNEVVRVLVDHNQSPAKILLKADYADLETPGAPTERELAFPPLSGTEPVQVQLEIKMPRYARIDPIKVFRSDVEISDMHSSLRIRGDRSTITVKEVGHVEVRTRAGDIVVEDASGLVDVASITGAIRVRGSDGAVRAVSIAGLIDIRCGHASVNASDTDGLIELFDIDGDVNAEAINSSVRFTGPLREDGRYHLKSMSGRVEMVLPPEAKDFDATLSSYRGTIDTDFQLEPSTNAHISQAGKHLSSRSDNAQLILDSSGKRLIGRFGSGKAQLILDSFEGAVHLSRAKVGEVKACQ